MPASDWNDLCPQTILWDTVTGRDAYGKPTYFNVGTFRGRRTFKNTRVKAYERGTKGQGAEMVSESQILILGTPAILYEDRVYVSGDDVNAVPPILSIERTPDENGDLFVKVLFGSSNG